MIISQKQKNTRINAVVTGIFFIMATATAIMGLKLYDPLLIGQNDYFQITRNVNQVALGAFFELLLVCSAIGTGIMLLPYLRLFNERLGLAYLCFRFLEAILITVGIVSLLALLSLSSFYSAGRSASPGNFIAEAQALRAIHDWTFILGPHFMLGINTFIYSYVFFKTGLVPKRLALMGLSGAVLIFIAAILELFSVLQLNSVAVIIMAVPIASYEMILAARLIAKGFNLNSE
ncbi:MAG: DUF4386 domain-containing protein, partial [Bacteroidia bacterium]|nr:DUF4386 domain-containing protein [Bacteroidia bacterium]